ncbi:MAG: RagB/SusD family nutrient uptake outer membrane protein [Bacteroidales bacterium]|nr:MAG: RagB/SusD family nutrient uptake outer membrane protein [Bacteroidales bacterium]
MSYKYILLLLFIFYSCEGIFHKEDNEYFFLDSEQEKVDLLNGINSSLVKVHNGNYFWMMSRADDVNYYTNYGFSYPGHACSSSSSGGNYTYIKDEIYLNLYKAIANANKLILQLDEDRDAAILGEACFLRAYCYFKLARFFGRPPLVTDIDVNYLLKKPEYVEVYELIESDLLHAIELLPENYLVARIPGESPDQGSAKALLAEVYLSMAGFPVNDSAKYKEAARLAGGVIEQSGFYNYVLLDDFANLWKNSYRHNSENIFGLFFSGENVNTCNLISSTRVWIDVSYFVQGYSIYGSYTPNFKFFNDFPYNYRKYNSIVTGEYRSISYDTIGGYGTEVYFMYYDPLYDACDYIDHAVPLKWIDVDEALRSEFNSNEDRYYNSSKVTLYLLRYAQTLLTYAEASARSGEPDASCYEAVNMIRRRANKADIYSTSEFDLKPGLTTEQFLDSVVWERAWELFFEPDSRWFDIIRLDLKNKLQDYIYSIDVPTKFPDDILTEDWYFLLIPQEDRWLNPNYVEDND